MHVMYIIETTLYEHSPMMAKANWKRITVPWIFFFFYALTNTRAPSHWPPDLDM